VKRSIWCVRCGESHDASIESCPRTGLSVSDPHPTQPSAYARAHVGKLIDSKYLVRAFLGEGGMAVVFEAEHVELGRKVALKVLHTRHGLDGVAVKRLKREAHLAGSIGHPNICEIHDIGLLADGTPYLVMERLVGETLGARLNRLKHIDPGLAIDIFVQVLSGLAATHAAGVVHRDISPRNIFLVTRLGTAPIAKILDFGLSKRMRKLNPHELSTDLTGTGVLVGTPHYFAPEQIRGEQPGPRTDVYACGVALYEAVTGRRPFPGKNKLAVMHAILEASLVRPLEIEPNISPQLDATIVRALARNPGDRFLSAAEFQRALNLSKQSSTQPLVADPMATESVDVEVVWSSANTARLTLPDEEPSSELLTQKILVRSLEQAPFDDATTEDHTVPRRPAFRPTPVPTSEDDVEALLRASEPPATQPRHRPSEPAPTVRSPLASRHKGPGRPHKR
jgi:eukaryotic-like serine/threonine-protein kinase